MVREIIWSATADKARFKIFSYWDKRNKSQTYSLKLSQAFIKAAETVAEIPELGIATNIPFTRYIIVSNYSVYYRITSTYIEVVTIWDDRRNPKKLKL